MDTKLSIALLSGISLFMSLGAFAISDDADNDLNWSYAMGGTMQAESKDFDELTAMLPATGAEPKSDITCTEGCPARAPKKGLTLTYEDEAMTLRDRTETMPTEPVGQVASSVSVRDKLAANRRIPARPDYSDQSYQDFSQDYQSVSVESRGGVSETVSYRGNWEQPQVIQNQPPQVETRYVEANPKVQYPITRQYPISVQYPITVQRNMTVEQPVIMQQPVIVRRPVVVQQDVTVRRQPTVVQQQPMVMQQQPSFIQQKPLIVQAPAIPMNQETLNSINGMLAQPQIMQIPQPQVNVAPMIQPQIQMPVMQAQEQMAQQDVQGQQPQANMPQMVQPQMQASSMQMPMMQPPMQQDAQMPQQQVNALPMMQNNYMPYAQQYQVQGQIQAQPIYTTMPTMYVQAPMVQQMGMQQQPVVMPQQTQAY